MWYAVWTITNSNHQCCGQIGGFIVDGEDENDQVPLACDTEDELCKILQDNMMYQAGLLEFIQI